ncbi:hypothetical protein SAMN04488523_101415 [Sulfitobacter brevis]|uniref:Uncharacterized protein n=1 Tax=Sulfitobacter brevis TaxID=74348 RepID=A0A1I1TK00_9RHOB|nr:hypothetical protein [Sulfitobacter brevis]SFD58889.1 hypothetical protein SAMN04488523_101415 [Sulfitobacter brevis]
MTQEGRVQRLEAIGGATKETILAVVPEHWDDDEVQAGITHLRKTFVLPCTWSMSMTRDQNLTEARLLFAGDLPALFKRVARRSGRIGIPSQEGQA